MIAMAIASKTTRVVARVAAKKNVRFEAGVWVGRAWYIVMEIVV